VGHLVGSIVGAGCTVVVDQVARQIKAVGENFCTAIVVRFGQA